MRKAFSFYRSHYEQMKLLNPTQISDITLAICEVQFLEVHIDDITFDDIMTQLVWTGIKHGVDASVKGYVNKKGNVSTPLPRGSENVTTPLEQEEEEEEEKEEEKEEEQQVTVEYPPGLNIEAYEAWLKYKGKNYRKASKTMSMNKLLKQTQEEQKQMVEDSIANGWKGLFPPKEKKAKPGDADALGKFESFMDMKEHLAANHLKYKDIHIMFEGENWGVGKNGIPWSRKNVDDMPFDQRKRFWLYLINNIEILGGSGK